MIISLPVPGSPPENVTAMAESSTTIAVMWEEVPPIDQNGVITMYEVMYTPLETFRGTLESNSTIVSGSDLSLNLTGLEEYVNYTISVRAFTIVGPSNGSIIVTAETFPDGNIFFSCGSFIYFCLYTIAAFPY